MATSLHAQLIRLAHKKPDLRPYLLPLLKGAASACVLLTVREKRLEKVGAQFLGYEPAGDGSENEINFSNNLRRAVDWLYGN